MNKMPEDRLVVIDIAGDKIAINVSQQTLFAKMKAVGFSHQGPLMTLSVDDPEHKQQILQMLVDESALFMCGNGWYPAEVMKYYADQGITFGKYNVIYWTNPVTYQIEER